MKTEDKAYFEMQPNLQGMKKVRDEIYALAQTHLRLSEKSTDSQKQNYEYRIAAGLSSFVSRAPYAAEIGMEFKGSAYWNKKAIQLAKEGAALGVIADKLIAEALSIYNSHSKPIEDKRYFAISPAETEKKIRDLTTAWRKLMNVADNLHGMANPSPEIMKRQDQVDADMERIGNQIAELKKSIGVQENVSVRLAKPVEDKAYFDKEWTEAGYTATNFFIMLERAMKSYEGQHDYEYRDKIIGLAKTLMQHPDFKVNGQSTRALAKKAFALVKFKYARQGVKTKFYLDPSNISLISKRVDSENRQNLQIVKQKQATNKKSDLMDAANLAHGMAYSNEYANHLNDLQKISQSKNPAHKQAAKEAISKIEAIESFWQKKYSDLQSQYRAAHSRQGFKSKFAATRIWPNDYSEILNANAKYARLIFDRQKIIRANAGKRIKGEQPLEVPALPTAPEFPFAFADGDYVGLVLGGQTNVPKGATVKWAHNANSIKMSRTGTKSKFASDTNYPHKNTIKIKGKSDKIYALIYAEEGYGDNLTGFWNGHVQNNTNPKVNDMVTIGQFKSKEAARAAAIKALKQEEQNSNFSKAKFANRGAFAEASSSPVRGSLLEKKVMPEGGWRAVETDGGALVIAFEDNDIAGNFARRASENGYSATAPMAMAGRYWNVKVQNENNK